MPDATAAIQTLGQVGEVTSSAARFGSSANNLINGGSTGATSDNPAAQLQAVLEESLRKSLEVQEVQARHAPAKQAAQIQA